jgi:hypothetical protein
MSVSFSVQGVPPKKDGSSSMWGKSSEIVRLKALRSEACRALSGHEFTHEPLALSIRVFAPDGAGDLDNFATGILDGLMAASLMTSIDPAIWSDVPEGVQPDKTIAFRDDKHVWRLHVERFPEPPSGPCYEVEIEWLTRTAGGATTDATAKS